jgi:poly(3-hydroxybutyrate) depolymerase
MKSNKVVFFLSTIAAAGLMFFVMAGCGSDNNSTASAGSGAVSTGTGGSSVPTGTSGTGTSVSGSGVVTGGKVATGNGGKVATATGGKVATGNGGKVATATGGKTGTAGKGGSTGGTAGSGSTAYPVEKSAGCGKEPPASVATGMNFQNVDRTFILDVPKTYDKNRPYPLVVVWHGAGVSAVMFHTYLTLPAAIGEDGIDIYMETAGGQSGSWDYTNDPLYFDAIVEKLEADYCIDKHRVFISGHSMGGMFTNYLACVRANVLRGAAPMAGPTSAVQCAGKLAIWYDEGLSDFAGVATDIVSYWVKNNGCDPNKTTPVTPSVCEGATANTPCETVDYTVGCENTPVRYTSFTGGHEIPSFIGEGIWNFFKSLK